MTKQRHLVDLGTTRDFPCGRPVESISGKTLKSGVEQTLPGKDSGIRTRPALPEPAVRSSHVSNYLHARGKCKPKVNRLRPTGFGACAER
jgi:hypothetical protein